MYKFFSTAFLCAVSFTVLAQTKPLAVPVTQPFGKIDIADLELKTCDFEPDANAMVLFDEGKITSDLFFIHHFRIKVFNDFGKSEGNIRISNFNVKALGLNDIEAETINLNDGKIEITPIDRKQIYIEMIDPYRSDIVFAMPNVKAGSVIDVKYRSLFNGVWYFQSSIPTRYSEIHTDVPTVIGVDFKFIPHIKQPYVRDEGGSTDYRQIKALANVHSLPNEAFMGSRSSNLQRLEFLNVYSEYKTWPKIGELVQKYYDRDQRGDAPFSGEDPIIDSAKKLKTDDEKIAFIYDKVKATLKWNNAITPFAVNSPGKVWDTKTGNSAEINWILFRLLRKSGIHVIPLMVGNKLYTKMNPLLPDIFSMAKPVVYIPVDSAKSYILDATNQYNLYNSIPVDVLNTFGLNLDKNNEYALDNLKYQMIFIENQLPVLQVASFNAEIKPEGKMSGTAEITSYSYNKINAVEKYKKEGEKNYIDSLRHNDNNVKITSLKMDDMEIDSLPLSQKINFDINLQEGDQNYIYFNTNLFNLPGDNPFKKEERFSDIDFGYKSDYSIQGIYKLPSGYKAEALPKSITMIMPDGSIVFKRIVVEEDGTLMIKYILDHKKTIYFKTDYQDMRGFYKQMYELLNEQIVLKKL